MFFDGDGEGADAGEVPPEETPKGSASEAADTAEQEDAMEEGASFTTSGSSEQNSPSFELDGDSAGNSLSDSANRLDGQEPDTPPTPPPKSPKSPTATLHRSPSDTSSVSGTSGTSRTSTESIVPSLCPSSPRSCSSGSTEPHFHLSPERAQSPLPPLPTESHIRVHVAADHSGLPGYSDLFAHHRHTQLLTSDLLASLDYNYSDALSQLGNSTSEHAPDSSLFPPGDFEPGSSAGTIKHAFSQAHAASQRSDVVHSHWRSASSEVSVPNMPPLLHSPPELPSSSSEDVSTDNSVSSSPIMSRSRSSSTVSSEYDFGDEEYGYYSYDVGPFQDPLESPSTTGQQRRFIGYGIPWPSTHRRSSGSAECGGSACSGGGMTDVLDDLEDLAEDVTERISLARTSPNNSVRSSFLSGSAEDDVFGFGCPGEGGLADAPGGDYSSYSRRPSGTTGSSQQQHHGGSSARAGSSSNGVSGGWSGRGGYRGGGGGGDDDGDGDDDRRRRPSRVPVSSSAIFSDSDEESESDYGESDDGRSLQGSPTANKRRQRHDTTRPGMPPTSSPPKDDTTDDDVPLAQQIPGALKAQRTIRRQVRDELDQKRAERRARARQALLQQQQHEEQRPTQPSQQSSPSRPVGRPRTRTLPGNMNSPFSAGDLTNKLLSLQTGSPGGASSVPAPVPPMPSNGSPLPGRSKRPSFDGNEQHLHPSSSLTRGRTITDNFSSFGPSAQRSQPAHEGSRTLRPTRSFHRRPRTADPDTTPPLPAQTPPGASLSRNGTTSTSLSRSGTTSRRRLAAEEPLPPPPYSANPPALDRGKSTRSAPSRRPSCERPENSGFVVTSRSRSAAAATHATVAPPPALPSVFSQPAKTTGAQMWQQRVFIGNMQRFVLVEIGSMTTAGDVLSIVDGQGALEQGRDGWMLWEVSQDFGMGTSTSVKLLRLGFDRLTTWFLAERPIRTFEMLNDVCGTWNSDKTVNLLVIKKTLLAPLLSPKAMPSSSPMCSGYVQWEHKRGKWQKRWMELREHSLWLSKRDTGKDAQFLCSLNNFDAYYVTRVHKAPKPYVFSVKSTDSLTYFEDTSDYVHVFSCGESEGKNWLEKILLARVCSIHLSRLILWSLTFVFLFTVICSLSRAQRRQRIQRRCQ